MKPEERKELQDHFGLTEQQVLDILANDDEKQKKLEFKRSNKDKKVL